MKKMFLLPLTVGLLLVSCEKETVAPQQQTVQQSADGKKPKPSVEAQEKLWNYNTQSWNTTGGTSTGWIACYDAQGTNQTTKRAVITVSNESYSADKITVRVQVTSSGCANTPSQEVLVFDVAKGATGIQHVIVSGYPSSQTRLRVQIRPSGSTSGSYSGLITYGYEY